MKNALKRIVIVSTVLFLLLSSVLTTDAADIRRFTDVRWNWAYEDISFCAEKEIMLGVSENRFAPDATVTRGMFCTVLYRLWSSFCIIQDGDTLIRGINVSHTTSFSDVEKGSWYEKGVAWAEENSLVNGFTDGTFRPGDCLSRTQMAVILNGFYEKLLLESSLPADKLYCDDAEIPAWGRDSVYRMTAAGLLSGNGNGRFMPLGNVTRSMTASVLHRLWSLTQNRLNDTNYISGKTMQITEKFSFKDLTSFEGWKAEQITSSLQIGRREYVQILSEQSLSFTETGLTIACNIDSGTLYSGGIEQKSSYPAEGTLWQISFILPSFGAAELTRIGLVTTEGDYTTVCFSPWNRTVTFTFDEDTVTLREKEIFSDDAEHTLTFYQVGGTMTIRLDGVLCTQFRADIDAEVFLTAQTVFCDGCGIIFPSILPECTVISGVSLYR